MAPNRHRRTTRRVTAQRKFAQGALVPPVVAVAPSNNATTSTTIERREAPTTTNDTCNIFHNNMSPKCLLDVVSFHGSHSHLQPIVLVERLRGKHVRGNNEQRQVDTVNGQRGLKVSVNVRPKSKVITRRKMTTANQHLMTLRSREQRSNPKWMTGSDNWRMPRKLSIQETRKPLPPKRNLLKKIIPRRYKRKSVEFTVEDNQPLKYFAKCSTPKAPAAIKTHTLMGPPTSIPAHITVPSIEILNTEPSTSETPLITPSVTPVIEIESSTQSVYAFRDTKIVNVATVTDRYFNELHGVPSTSSRQLDQPSTSNFGCECSPAVGYYGEQGIHRWMEGSIPEERASSPSPQQHTSHQSTQYKEEDAQLESDQPEVCTAYAWKSVEDVVKATKSDFDSRCTICKQCERIEKVLKLTCLLKRQRKIDCLTDDTEPRGRSQRLSTSSRSADENVKSNGNLNLISELLPRHPHLLIKMTVMTINAKEKFAACLIPRSEAGVAFAEQFKLSRHDYLLDQMIETLSLNLGDPPSNLVRPDTPTLSGLGTKDKAGQFEQPECSNSSEKNIEEDNGTILEALTLWPSTEELDDPIAYIEKMWDRISQYGICKIVPPEAFVSTCKADDDIRFEVTNQYTSRLYNRWGPAAREMCAIKACLKAQNISFHRPPLLEGLEVNLPKLYHLVQRHGGLENVINKKKWSKVAEDMKLNKNPIIERKLDAIYFKYLLPYDTLSAEERQEFLRKVEKAWNKKNQKLLDRANNPLHRQKRLLGESDSSSDETEDDEIADAEECVKPGTLMNLAKFKKIARTAFDNFFRNQAVHTKQIEEEYWRRVTLGTEHICVNSSSIDTLEQGLGFPRIGSDSDDIRSWNLKTLSEHPSNVLRSLGPALGVTVPTLHLGMVFSSSCWHRDPHSIAWVEYLHRGTVKIWYGVPEQQDLNFRRGTETLNPTACQSKSLWLSSDIAMIPPNLLREHSVKVYRVEQLPGEYVVVMPRAYSCSVSTGYTVSESAYFATERWLDNLMSVFKEIQHSCEPTMFALEQLLKCIAEDPHAKQSVLRKIKPALELTFKAEIENRELLEDKGIKVFQTSNSKPEPRGRGQPTWPNEPTPPPVWNVRDQDECEICRCTLYLSKVKNIPMKNSMVCLEHTLKLLSKRKYDHIKIEDLEMYYAFSTQQLQDTIRTIQRRVGTNYKNKQQ